MKPTSFNLLTCILLSGVLHPASLSALEMEHGIAYYEPGRHAAWPANGNCWNWGDEILILHTEATFYDYKHQHNYDRGKPGYARLSRSKDGGKTWESERTRAFSRERPTSLNHKMDFSHPDFGFRSRDELFWYTLDRGMSWEGPFLYPDFGLDNALTSRTDYILYDEDTMICFLSVKEEDVSAPGELQDRAFTAWTNDGGLTWSRQGWMTGYPYQVRSVMSSTVVLQGHELLSVVRRRIDAHEEEDFGRMDLNFIEAEYSDTNGRSWEKRSMVAFTDLTHHNGNPPALAKLPDGRVAVMYGFRGYPFGIRAKVSEDGGKTWGHEIILRDDARNYDLGYPEAVTLPDGRIFVCYYIGTEDRPEQHIAYTIWKP